MPDSEFSPYAPVRQNDTYWHKYAKHYASIGVFKADGRMLPNADSLIFEEVVKPRLQAAAQHMKAEGLPIEALAQLASNLFSLRNWIPLLSQYHLNGKQIFDIGDEAVTLLRNTDVEDCVLDDWNGPYDAFFVRFGKQDDMKLVFGKDEFEYLDGAYVAVTPAGDGGQKRLKIGLTTVKADGRGVMMPGYFIDFFPSELKLNPSLAVEAAIARKVDELDKQEDASGFNEVRKGEWKEGAALLKAALPLVVNSLFYLESFGKDLPLEPGRDVPPQLDASWRQVPENRRFKAAQKVTREGYVFVHMAGKEFAGTQSRTNADANPHWRRGHWRRQHYGERNSMVKRVWIRPVLVNAEKAEEVELPGHIYVASEHQRERPH
jgi:hypothetical protein